MSKANGALGAVGKVITYILVVLLVLGIAGGIGEGLLIKKGEIVKKVPEGELLSTLKDELDNWK